MQRSERCRGPTGPWQCRTRQHGTARSWSNVEWIMRFASLCALLFLTTATHGRTTVVPLAQARLCISEHQAVPSWSGRRNERCIVRFETIARTVDAELLAGWYCWPGAKAPARWRPSAVCSADPTRYSVTTLVLFEHQLGSKTARVLHAEQLSEEEELFESVRMHDVQKEKIVDLSVCLNGTGGCGQELLAWRGHALHPRARNLRDRFDRALPRGFTTYKSPWLDLETMRVRGGGWKRGKDANCCPSIQMECIVALRGDSAGLSRCRTGPNTD
jgi:hypothetical protein